MSSNPEPEKPEKILSYQNETNELLREIIGILKAATDRTPDEGNPILVHESRGSCPQCESPSVDLAKTDSGHFVYQCKDCELVWVNDERAVAEFSQ